MKGKYGRPACPVHPHILGMRADNGFHYCSECPSPYREQAKNQYTVVRTVYSASNIDLSKPQPERFKAQEEAEMSKRNKNGRFAKKVATPTRGRKVSFHDDMIVKFIAKSLAKNSDLKSSVLLRMYRESGKGCGTKRFFGIHAAM